jgi:hypothetical protein
VRHVSSYGTRGAGFEATAATDAFFIVNISEVIFYGNGLVRACFRALPAPDTSYAAIFLGNGTFFCISTSHVKTSGRGVFVSHFNQKAGTIFGTCPARHAFEFINFGQSCFLIYGNSIKRAGVLAVS